MRLGRNFVTAFFGLLLLASMGFISAALADTTTDTVGGTGGKAFVASCNPGEALVGINYNSGEMMYAIAVVCRPVANGAFTGPAREDKNVFGLADPASHGNPASLCPDGDAVRQIYVYVTEHLRVHHVRMICYPIGGSGQGFIVKATVAAGDITTHGSPGCASRDVGNYASGLIGAFGGGVLRLGLQCHSPADEATNTDTGDTNTANTDTTNTDTNNGDQGNDNGNTVTIKITPPDLKLAPPSGKIRKVQTATTLYSKPGGKEIAYLDVGDPVKIIACDNNGWCQVSKPKGYVWADDLE